IDLDIIAVHMSYVQCTLLHIPAIILHGDTLRGETYSVWRTFAHVMGFWDAKLARDRRTLPAAEDVAPIAPATHTPNAVAPQAALDVHAPPASPLPHHTHSIKTSGSQLTLF